MTTKRFITKDELNKLDCLYKRCISISYNLLTLQTTNPQEDYNKYITTIKEKYGDFNSITEDGEIK